MSATLELPKGIKTLQGVPVDSRYYNNNNTPYLNIGQVLSENPIEARSIGLTVSIQGVEYWFKEGTTDNQLVPKADYNDLTNVPPPVVVTFTKNVTPVLSNGKTV